jgi:hypothetical protein
LTELGGRTEIRIEQIPAANLNVKSQVFIAILKNWE